MVDVTVHMVVKNDDRWVWFALMAVRKHVKKILVTDTGSTDRTVEIIQSIKDPNIELSISPTDDPKKIVQLRQKQIQKTKTPWILLVDGDEIWPLQELRKVQHAVNRVSQKVKAIVVHDKRCVGDIFHVLPESYGRYVFKGQRGHVSIRLLRNTRGLDVRGVYPHEWYVDEKGRSLNDQDDALKIVDAWYLHTTHLPRSSKSTHVLNRRGKQKVELGIPINREDLPDIFSLRRPAIVPDPMKKRPVGYTIAAACITPLRRLKQYIRA